MSDEFNQYYAELTRRGAQDGTRWGAGAADYLTKHYQDAKNFLDEGWRPSEVARVAPQAGAAAENMAASGVRGMMYRALPYAPQILRGASRALSISPPVAAGLTGYDVGSHAYGMMPRSMQDTIGGTINQVMQRFGGGVDDSDYLRTQQEPQYGMQRRVLPMMQVQR